eukprot:m.18917 g.18917  ORF g.18917 m.18917 type:complete len:238 (+) comp27752_c0_seq1:71-784(+)
MDSLRGGSGASRRSPSNRKSPKQRRLTSQAAKPPLTSSKSAHFTGKPSDKLNPKTIDPFNDRKHKTSFSAVYSSGGIPCRLVHGSVRHKLRWDANPETVPFDPVLVTLAEGLRETEHPHPFVAREGFKDLLQVQNAGEKTKPLLEKLVAPLRACLISSRADVFKAGLAALCQLSNATKEALNPYLKSLLSPISKRMLDKDLRDNATTALQQLEINGGQDALVVLKSKVPTYSSVTTP